MIQQLQKYDSQTINNIENNTKNIKVESENTNSKHLIQVTKDDTLELLLQKFNFLVKETHTEIKTKDGYIITSVGQLKEGEQYIFK